MVAAHGADALGRPGRRRQVRHRRPPRSRRHTGARAARHAPSSAGWPGRSLLVLVVLGRASPSSAAARSLGWVVRRARRGRGRSSAGRAPRRSSPARRGGIDHSLGCLRRVARLPGRSPSAVRRRRARRTEIAAHPGVRRPGAGLAARACRWSSSARSLGAARRCIARPGSRRSSTNATPGRHRTRCSTAPGSPRSPCSTWSGSAGSCSSSRVVAAGAATLPAQRGARLGRRASSACVGVVLTLITLYDISEVGAQTKRRRRDRAVAEPRRRRLAGLRRALPASAPAASSPPRAAARPQRRRRRPTPVAAGAGAVAAARCRRHRRSHAQLAHASASRWRCSTRRRPPRSGRRCWSPRSASTCCWPSA